MNLYLVERKDKIGWGEFIAAVVAAESEVDARYVHPSPGKYNSPLPYEWKSEWLDVTFLGVAKDGTKRGSIMDSFNAG